MINFIKSKCTGCTICKKVCPMGVIEIKAKKATISVGDKVKFEDKKGKEGTGTLTKVNRTKAIVKERSAKRDDRGILTGASSLTWSVPITLLDLA